MTGERRRKRETPEEAAQTDGRAAAGIVRDPSSGHDGRKAVRRAFLKAVGCAPERIEAIPGDASLRRYFRLRHPAGDGWPGSLILMDAPPGHEDVRPFVAIDGLLRRHGFAAPEIFAADPGNGLLLIEDFGDDSFTRLLAAPPDARRPDEEHLYAAAVDLLAALQHRIEPPSDGVVAIDWPVRTLSRADAVRDFRIPSYDRETLWREVRLFCDWYLPLVRGRACEEDERAAFHALWMPILTDLERMTEGRPVLVLRDHHADNLMWRRDGTGHGRIGLLDFQDAVIGHPAYDLVSLLQDARRDVPEELEQRMIRRHVAATGCDRETFRRAYALFGAQRATKIIGIFARLARRDGKPRYLSMIPRVWALLERDLAISGTAELKRWFDRVVPPERRRRVPRPVPHANEETATS